MGCLLAIVDAACGVHGGGPLTVQVEVLTGSFLECTSPAQRLVDMLGQLGSITAVSLCLCSLLVARLPRRAGGVVVQHGAEAPPVVPTYWVPAGGSIPALYVG